MLIIDLFIITLQSRNTKTYDKSLKTLDLHNPLITNIPLIKSKLTHINFLNKNNFSENTFWALILLNLICINLGSIFFINPFPIKHMYVPVSSLQQFSYENLVSLWAFWLPLNKEIGISLSRRLIYLVKSCRLKSLLSDIHPHGGGCQ